MSFLSSQESAKKVEESEPQKTETEIAVSVEPETKPAAELAQQAEPVTATVPEDGDDGKGWHSQQTHVASALNFNLYQQP